MALSIIVNARTDYITLPVTLTPARQTCNE